MHTREHDLAEAEPPALVPAGYMAKKVCTKPDWLKSAEVADIYSVSGCIANCFTDYVAYWKHNGFWLFDRPELIEEIATSNSLDMTTSTIFYYEVFANEYDTDDRRWVALGVDPSLLTNVQVPEEKILVGYDVVSFWAHSSPECSPLSCNHLAEVVSVNEHCLLRTFSEAESHLANGAFSNAEPGPYRIFAVYRLPDKYRSYL